MPLDRKERYRSLSQFPRKVRSRPERSCRIAVIPCRIKFDGVNLGSPKQLIKRSRLWRPRHWYANAHKIGISYHPLERLHSAHGTSYYRVQVRQVKHVGTKPIFHLHHVAYCEAGAFHERLFLTDGRRTRHTISNGVYQELRNPCWNQPHCLAR